MCLWPNFLRRPEGNLLYSLLLPHLPVHHLETHPQVSRAYGLTQDSCRTAVPEEKMIQVLSVLVSSLSPLLSPVSHNQ